MYSIIPFNKNVSNKKLSKYLWCDTFITEQILENGTKRFSPKYNYFQMPRWWQSRTRTHLTNPWLLLVFRAVFNWVLKVISELLWFMITSLSDWFKVLAPFFNQWELKPKPIVARACTFSCALCRLRVMTSSFDWFTGLSPSFLIGQSNYFGFGFTTLNWNSLYSHVIHLGVSRSDGNAEKKTDLGGNRTHDHQMKSPLLFRLSYEVSYFW